MTPPRLLATRFTTIVFRYFGILLRVFRFAGTEKQGAERVESPRSDLTTGSFSYTTVFPFLCDTYFGPIETGNKTAMAENTCQVHASTVR